ncbi:MAG TPA: response regulator transcription factor [Trebonia sp.]|jgi:DNA-binding NarL/FixJ family response regulator|nr:response regulator transcription factor [Trebonia sp.]
MAISVLVVDEERIFADVVAAQLEAEEDIEVVAAVDPGTHGEFLRAGRHADVVLLDADLADDAAITLCQELTQLGSRVVMLSDTSSAERIVAYLRAGASGWVRKDESFEHLLTVVRGTMRGEAWLPPAETGAVLQLLMRTQRQQQEDDTLLAALTPREREVLACLADGDGRRDVAERLYLSANTVRTHLQNLMAKLGVHSTLEAVALTRRAELEKGESH